MALLHVNFYSDILEMETEMEVILPQVTASNPRFASMRADGTYPVLYLLHGMNGNQTSWIRKTSIERYVSNMGLAVVMPSTDLGWYTDTAYGMKYWTFLSEELPKICCSLFPCISNRREDTFAAGLSMGGYGAVKLGLGAPERFSAVASLSGALDMMGMENSLDPKDRVEYWEGVFGPLLKAKGSQNDLFTLADQLAASGRPRPKMYMWCGTEDFIYGQNVRARDHFLKAGYDLTYEESPGTHEWVYWDEKIQRVLKWLPLVSEAEAE